MSLLLFSDMVFTLISYVNFLLISYVSKNLELLGEVVLEYFHIGYAALVKSIGTNFVSVCCSSYLTEKSVL